MTFRLTMHQAGSHEKDLDLARDLFFKFFKMWFNREYFSGERFGDGPVISDGFFIMILLVIIFIVGAFITRGKIKYDGDVRDIVNTAGPVFMGYTIYMLFYCFMYAYTQDDHLVGDSFGYAGRYLGPAVMLVTAVVIHELLCIKNIDHSRLLACTVVVLMILIPDGPFRILALEDTNYWGAYNAMYADAALVGGEAHQNVFAGEERLRHVDASHLVRLAVEDMERLPRLAVGRNLDNQLAILVVAARDIYTAGLKLASFQPELPVHFALGAEVEPIGIEGHAPEGSQRAAVRMA